MRSLDLFAGAGGGVLGGKLLDWQSIGYVEWEPYCQKILQARIADGCLDAAPIFGDIRKFVSEGYAHAYQGMVDVVTAGFPCQPFSVAGKKAAADDPRNMWPATADVLRIVQPHYALLENVPGLFATGYCERIFADLAELGLDAKWGVFSAAEESAPHLRERLFILAADPKREGLEGQVGRRLCLAGGGRTTWPMQLVASPTRNSARGSWDGRCSGRTQGHWKRAGSNRGCSRMGGLE